MAEQEESPTVWGAVYETAEERDFGTEKEDVKAYAVTAGTIAGAAACSATGAGVAVAAACGYVGGEIAGWIVETFWGNDEEQARIHAEQAAQWEAWDATRKAFVLGWHDYANGALVELGAKLNARFMRGTLSGAKKQGASSKGAPLPEFRARMSDVDWPPEYVRADPILHDVDWEAQSWADEQKALAFWLEWPLLAGVGATPQNRGQMDAGLATSGAWKSALPEAEQRFNRLAADYRGAILYAAAPEIGEKAAKEAKKKELKKKSSGGGAAIAGGLALGAVLVLALR